MSDAVWTAVVSPTCPVTRKLRPGRVRGRYSGICSSGWLVVKRLLAITQRAQIRQPVLVPVGVGGVADYYFAVGVGRLG